MNAARVLPLPGRTLRGLGRPVRARMLLAPMLLASSLLPDLANAETTTEAAAPEPLPPVTGVDPEAAQRAHMLRLGMAGGMAFAQVYTLTVLVASGALLLCWDDPEGEHCGLPSARSAWYELYIPLAGPFVTLRHEEVRSNWKYAVPFVGSGVLQSVGVGLAVMSLLWSKGEVARAPSRISVVATGETLGFALRGDF